MLILEKGNNVHKIQQIFREQTRTSLGSTVSPEPNRSTSQTVPEQTIFLEYKYITDTYEKYSK